MKKIAIFVEGKTEVAFIEQLVREVVAERSLHVVLVEATGGRKTPRRLDITRNSTATPEQKYHVQIVDSRGDNRIASDIRDNYSTLLAAGFEAIIGIRDAYPVARADIPALRRGLHFRLRTDPVRPVFVIGVVETEAWFLAEYTHFIRIHPSLTPARIEESVGFNPCKDDMQLRECPHDDLHNIYALEGLAYRKSAFQIQRTVSALDCARVYLDLPGKFSDLEELMSSLDEFFV